MSTPTSLNPSNEPFPFGPAEWIGHPEYNRGDASSRGVTVFRHDFDLADAPLCAQMGITAVGRYVLWVNDSWANDGPASSSSGVALLDQVDISGLLRSGTNSLAVVVWSADSVPALLVDGQIETSQGITAVSSGTDWQVLWGNWIDQGVDGQCGMVFRSADEPLGWRNLEPSEGWQQAEVISRGSLSPLLELRERPIAALYEKDVVAQLAWLGQGPRVIRERGQALVDWFNAAAVEGDGMFRLGATPARYDLTCDNVLTFDLGRACFCRPRLRITSEEEGGAIAVFYHGVLGERPRAAMSTRVKGRQTCDVVHLREGEIEWTSLAPRGARYVTLLYAGASSCSVHVSVSRVRYPFAGRAQFSSDVDLLEQIWKTAADTLRAATSDVYGCSVLGDTALQPSTAAAAARGAFYTFGETAMWRRCLSLAPRVGVLSRPIDELDTATSLSEMLHWARSCWDYYMASGDIGLLHEVVPHLSRLLDRSAVFMTDKDLLALRRAADADSDCSSSICSLELNALLFGAARAISRIARTIGDASLQETAVEFASAIDQEIPRFYDVRSRRYQCWLYEGKRPERVVDGAMEQWLVPNLLLCREGLGPNAQRKATVASIAALCEPPMGRENRFSPALAADVGRLLGDNGYADTGFRFLQSVYAEQVYGGAPTFGERFVGGVTGDAFSAAASINSYLVEDVIGLRPLVAGWRRILLRPSFLVKGLSYAVHTPAGKVSVEMDGQRIMATHPKGIQLECEGKVYAGTAEPCVVLELS